MDESKSVSGSTARPRGVWIATVGVVIVALLLLNVDSIGRVAMAAYDRMQARQAQREQTQREQTQRARSSTPTLVTLVEVPQPASAVQTAPPPHVAPAPAAAMPSTAVPAAAMPATAVRAAAVPATAMPPTDVPAAQPVQRLYPSPANTAPVPSGRAGLVMLIRSGVLRPASGADLAHWKMRYASTNPGGVGRQFDEWTRSMPAYVIVGDMAIPDGLAGANSVIFLLGDKVPFPTGDPGHSVILDPVSGSCLGTACRMIMER